MRTAHNTISSVQAPSSRSRRGSRRTPTSSACLWTRQKLRSHGNFKDDRLGLNIVQTPDLVTDKLPALRAYQFSLAAPTPPADSFDAEAAARGKTLFEGKAQCASCHGGTSFTDAPKLHAASETGSDAAEAMRSATGKYRATPLKGAFSHPPYFHDGSAATLADVINHYDTFLTLGLADNEKTDLAMYLKSL